MASNERYDGRPLFILLDCYVLWAIGELDQTQESLMVEIEPKLSEIFHRQGNWRDITAQVMGFPEEMPELIRAMWAENTGIAAQNSTRLNPKQFAQMFVDSNFPL